MDDADPFAISSDGNDWGVPFLGIFPSAVREVRFQHGLFIAVGDNGTIVTSTDGNSWQSQNSGTSQDLYGVALDSRFFVVGEGGTIMESSNWDIAQAELSITNTGWVNVIVHGAPGVRYRIQDSEDLQSWHALADVLLTHDRAAWIEPASSGFQHRFFRAIFMGPPSPGNAPRRLDRTNLELHTDYGTTLTMRIDSHGLYYATFPDNTTESGPFEYTDNWDDAVLNLRPFAGTPWVIHLTFSSLTEGTYTSDGFDAGTFTMSQ